MKERFLNILLAIIWSTSIAVALTIVSNVERQKKNKGCSSCKTKFLERKIGKCTK
jgi:hypothetical protein